MNKDCTNIWFERLSPLILKILDHWETNNKIQLTEILCILAVNDANKIKIAEEREAIPNLIKLLDSSDVDLQTYVAGILCNLSVNDANREKIAEEQEAIPKLMVTSTEGCNFTIVNMN